ncbi:6-phospho-beta-glucosidase [Vibrio mytili]|uniref:6-phospho-beta-glucosidase n=1 Tax=Vibrio mytili TaxID=50718 RepID=UPI002F3EC146
MKHVFNLVDGVLLNGELHTKVTLFPLTREHYDAVELLVDQQINHLKFQPNFKLVNDSHSKALRGHMLLNECAATSISHIGDVEVSMVFNDFCELNISAQDWVVILTANLAVTECYADSDSYVIKA